MPKDLCWSDRKICFMPINRVGSSSITHGLIQILGPFSHKRPAVELPDDWFIFAFVRNPWDRLVSAYSQLIKQGKLTGIQRARGFDKTDSFTDFVIKVTNGKDKYADKHIVSQSRRLAPKGDLIPGTLYKFEKMEEDWMDLCSVLQGYCPLPWLKKSPDIDVIESLKPIVEQQFEKDYILWGMVE